MMGNVLFGEAEVQWVKEMEMKPESGIQVEVQTGFGADFGIKKEEGRRWGQMWGREEHG